MTRVANEYAQALYELARDEGLSDQILAELNALGEAVRREEAWLRLLSAPNVPKEERCALLDQGFRGKVHPYVLNFLKILTEKGYARQLPACCDAYQALYNEDHGILVVHAVSAVPLTGDQEARLCAKLEKITGKRVTLRTSVDEACLGGLRLDYDGKRADDTVRHRLDALAGVLENTML